MHATYLDMLASYGEDALKIAARRDGSTDNLRATVETALADASAEINAWSIHCAQPWTAAQLKTWCKQVAIALLSEAAGPYSEQREKRKIEIKAFIQSACPAPQAADSDSANNGAGQAHIATTSQPRRFTRHTQLG